MPSYNMMLPLKIITREPESLENYVRLLPIFYLGFKNKTNRIIGFYDISFVYLKPNVSIFL